MRRAVSDGGCQRLNDNDNRILHLAAGNNFVAGGKRRHNLVLLEGAQMAGYHHNAALVLYHELDAAGELACNVIARGAGGWGRERNLGANCKRRLIRVVLLFHDGAQVNVDAAVHDTFIP